MTFLKKFLQDNAYSIISAVLGGVIALTSYLVISVLNNNLDPLRINLRDLATRVQAIEDRNDRVDPLVDEFIGIKQTVKEMDKKVDRIEGKVDRLIENR
jgi:hypothetical protein